MLLEMFMIASMVGVPLNSGLAHAIPMPTVQIVAPAEIEAEPSVNWLENSINSDYRAMHAIQRSA